MHLKENLNSGLITYIPSSVVVDEITFIDYIRCKQRSLTKNLTWVYGLRVLQDFGLPKKNESSDLLWKFQNVHKRQSYSYSVIHCLVLLLMTLSVLSPGLGTMYTGLRTVSEPDLKFKSLRKNIQFNEI